MDAPHAVRLDERWLGRSLIPAVLTAVLLVIFFVGARPTFTLHDLANEDGADYAFGAASLLQGQYSVAWEGAPRSPNMTPGFPALLAPAVALGGIEAAGWVPYLGALLLGVLIALIAAELGGPLAAPVAVAAVLFSRDVVTNAQVVLSDLPTATIAVVQLTLLVRAARTRGWAPVALAGLTAGYLPWMRPATILFLVAGVAALSALPGWRRNVLIYLTASAPLLVLLGIWQWSQFGSPLMTAYQAHGASADGSSAFGALFDLRYVLGLAQHASSVDTQPNAVVYARHLLGLDGSSLLPGLGAIGLVAVGVWARQAGTTGAIARFGLVGVAVTLCTYLPYFWQDTRFLMTPTLVLGLCGAVASTQLLRRLARSIGSGGDQSRALDHRLQFGPGNAGRHIARSN